MTRVAKLQLVSRYDITSKCGQFQSLPIDFLDEPIAFVLKLLAQPEAAVTEHSFLFGRNAHLLGVTFAADLRTLTQRTLSYWVPLRRRRHMCGRG